MNIASSHLLLCYSLLLAMPYELLTLDTNPFPLIVNWKGIQSVEKYLLSILLNSVFSVSLWAVDKVKVDRDIIMCQL